MAVAQPAERAHLERGQSESARALMGATVGLDALLAIAGDKVIRPQQIVDLAQLRLETKGFSGRARVLQHGR
jgi:hypothetical protein